jgi:hypothetical protein
MRANPGGILDSSDVLGRDRLIDLIWTALAKQSVVLTSERRIGKTSVIRKMAALAPNSSYFIILRDIEGLRTPEEFVEAVYTDVQNQLGKLDRAKLGLWKLLNKLGGAEIVDVKLPEIRVHWKGLLTALFEDLFEAESREVIFFWDELPLFIFNVAKSSGDGVAMELLDVLRGLRQRHTRLRMVFTGSVGIHQVVNNLRKSGYANDPTNDMAMIEVPPLSDEDGTFLASRLLEGESLAPPEMTEELGRVASLATGHIPYYIHVLISRLRTRGQRVTSDAITDERDRMIQDPNDPAHFSYYEERLTTYYSPFDVRLSLSILDILSPEKRPMTFTALANLIRYKIETAEDEQIRQVLKVLVRDHYLYRDSEGAYDFRYTLIKRWWSYSRGQQ